MLKKLLWRCHKIPRKELALPPIVLVLCAHLGDEFRDFLALYLQLFPDSLLGQELHAVFATSKLFLLGSNHTFLDLELFLQLPHRLLLTLRLRWFCLAHYQCFLLHLGQYLLVENLQAVSQLFVLAPHCLIVHLVVVDCLGNVVKPFCVSYRSGGTGVATSQVIDGTGCSSTLEPRL